jgi:hypothetical protein
VDHSISQPDSSRRISEIENKIEDILYTNYHKTKISTCDYKIQKLWGAIKKSNLRIHRVEKRVEIQTKGIGNLVNKIIAENFPRFCHGRDSYAQEHYKL